EKFVGSWELKKWTAELNDGTLIFPFGEDATGRITYESNGNMCVHVMKNNRPRFQSEDPLQAKPDEMVIAYKEFFAYCGTYDVYINPNQLVHQIKISSVPNWTGQNQIRKYEFKDDKLILSTDTIGASKHKLVWQKN
ncbi:MAG TPA: lipocalin-like domain-containing protein, partial [Draconibacterium sp.]|nr:lipocalin-like domain-containing protein [Draconibacterium sp.]